MLPVLGFDSIQTTAAAAAAPPPDNRQREHQQRIINPISRNRLPSRSCRKRKRWYDNDNDNDNDNDSAINDDEFEDDATN